MFWNTIVYLLQFPPNIARAVQPDGRLESVLGRQLDNVSDFLSQLGHKGVGFIEVKKSLAKASGLNLIRGFALFDNPTTAGSVQASDQTGGARTGADIETGQAARGEMEDRGQVSEGGTLEDFRIPNGEQRHSIPGG
jgi:hypothetical protein